MSLGPFSLLIIIYLTIIFMSRVFTFRFKFLLGKRARKTDYYITSSLVVFPYGATDSSEPTVYMLDSEKYVGSRLPAFHSDY